MDALRSPAAFDRSLAAAKLLPLLDESDIRKIGFTGWVRANGRKDKPDLQALHVLLVNAWSEEAEGVIPDILAIQDEYWQGPFSYVLYKHDHYDLMYESGVIQDNMKEMWYSEFRGRFPISNCWPHMYKHIVEHGWLYNMWIADPYIPVTDRCIAAILAGNYDTEIVANADGSEVKAPSVWAVDFPFLYDLQQCYSAGENKLDRELVADVNTGASLGHKNRTDEFGDLTWAETICLILDKPQWVLDIQERLQNVSVQVRSWYVDPDHGGWVFDVVSVPRDYSSTLVKLMALSATAQYDKVIEILEDSLRDKWPGFPDIRVVQHHPWFEKLYLMDRTWDWLEENTNGHFERYGERDHEARFTDWRR